LYPIVHGETPDDTIAHLAVAFSCPIIKTGAVGGETYSQTQRTYRIEEEMNNPEMADIAKYR